jgi:hypothetical protein
MKETLEELNKLGRMLDEQRILDQKEFEEQEKQRRQRQITAAVELLLIIQNFISVCYLIVVIY